MKRLSAVTVVEYAQLSLPEQNDAFRGNYGEKLRRYLFVFSNCRIACIGSL